VVKVNGQDIKVYKSSALRRCIGYVGQEPVLFATSVRENIMQGARDDSEADFKNACADAQLQFVDALPAKYDTFVGSGGNQFSGGQKQRIAIARALMKKANFLFLDEATSALDNTSERMIQTTLDNISSKMESGLGMVMIAHRLSTVHNCDLIYVLSRGAVVEQGDHETLMEKRGVYYALAVTQQAAEGSQKKQEEEEVNEAQDEIKLVTTDASGQVPTDASGKRNKTEVELEAEREAEILKTYKVPLARLNSFNKPEWHLYLPGMLGALAEGATMPVCALILSDSMTAFFEPKEKMRRELEMLCIYFGLLGAGDFLANTLEHSCFAILGEAMTQRIRVAVLRAIFRQEIGFHDDPDNTPGKLAKALELWAYRVSNLCKGVAMKAGAMNSILVGLVIAFASCWQMSLVMLGSIPIMIAANALQMLVILGATKNENEDLKQAQQIVSDSVSNSRTVQALGNEQELYGLYSQRVLKTGEGLYQRHTLSGLGFGIATGVMNFIMAGGFYYAAYLANEGVADFGDIMKAFMGIFYAGMGAGQAAALMGDATKATVACYEMFQLLDKQSKIDGLEPTGETPQALEPGQLEFVDVKFFYPFRPQVQVLKGVSFQIKPGMSVGLVGPSGGGKSTVMSMIQRFYDPQEGSVLVGEEKKPLGSLNIRWWRRQIGFVGQEPILFNTSVRENILYGCEEGEQVDPAKIEKCQKMCNLGFLFKNGNEGLETQVGPRGSRLSGGQKQRVAICRALIRDPKVMMLDEATSALDTQSERIVQKALENARQGRTSIAIAHRLSTISGSDLIIVCAEGVVVEQGTHAELMHLGGVYSKLQSQSQKS